MRRQECLYAVLALTGGIIGGFASSKMSSTAVASIAQISQPTIAAQQILLLDAKGNTRCALTLNKEGDPAFSMYDHGGKLRTALKVNDDEGVGFDLFDTTGALRISMSINSNQIPALRMFDAQHHQRALLGVDPEGEAALDFYSQEDKLLRELP